MRITRRIDVSVVRSMGFQARANLIWDSDTGLLLSRVVTRGAGPANLIIGDIVDFLLRRYSRRIEAINIIPR